MSGNRPTRRSMRKGRRERSQAANRALGGVLSPALLDRARRLKHPSALALMGFFVGDLKGPAADAVRLHVGRCPECQGFLKELADFGGPISEEEAASVAPRRIADMGYVLRVHDVVRQVERAATGRGKTVGIGVELNEVPDFFKKRLLSFDLPPQAYLSRALEALVETIHSNGDLQLSADVGSDCFIVRVEEFRADCRIAEDKISFISRGSSASLGVDLFLLLYPIWTSEKAGYCPTGSRLPRVTIHAPDNLREALLRFVGAFRRMEQPWLQSVAADLEGLFTAIASGSAEPCGRALLSPPEGDEQKAEMFSGADMLADRYCVPGAEEEGVCDLAEIVERYRSELDQVTSSARHLILSQFGPAGPRRRKA